MQKILIIDDDRAVCALLEKFLLKKGFDVEKAYSGKQGLDILRNQGADLVLSDFRLGDMDGLELLVTIRKQNLVVPFICITGYTEVQSIVSLMKNGCSDYIEKPIYPEMLVEKIIAALDGFKMECSEPTSDCAAIVETTGNIPYKSQSTSMKSVYQQMQLIAQTPYSVILLGENGIGKEVTASTIHRLSDRKDRPFVAVDCGVLSQELAGSELFGHCKGAFTGAITDHSGYFEVAQGGTLFLDEVGNLPLNVQIQLLRVLQEMKYRKVGTTNEISADVRIIAATNEDLSIAIEKGCFREDLFHRLNQFSIQLPSLRERPEDILPLAEHFLHKFKKDMNKEIEAFTTEFKDILLRYDWRGNIRELQNTIRRAVIMTPSGENIEPSVLPSNIVTALGHCTDIEPIDNQRTEDPLTSDPMILKNASTSAENDVIISALKRVNFNKKKASQILNIDRKTLYNKLKKMSQRGKKFPFIF